MAQVYNETDSYSTKFRDLLQVRYYDIFTIIWHKCDSPSKFHQLDLFLVKVNWIGLKLYNDADPTVEIIT